MPKVFKNVAEAMVYLEQHVILNLDKIGEEIKGVLRQYVNVLWYNRPYTPTHYTRTMELIESISVTKVEKDTDGSYKVIIYFDTDKIHPYPPPPGEWSKHQSITNSEDVSEFIPIWIERGQKSPLFSYEGVYPVQETIDWEKEDQYIKNRMIDLLQQQGWKVLNRLE